jgi:CheY-like chemotaxis protein
MCLILLVEDNVDTVSVLKKTLGHWGHDVIAAGTVEGGLALAKSKPFDAILSDIGLPDGDGFQLMREIKNTVSKRAVALAVTAWSTSADRARAKLAGFHHFFGKPIDLERLRSVLSTVL